MATIGEGLSSAGASIGAGLKERGKKSRLKDMMDLYKAGDHEAALALATSIEEVKDVVALRGALEPEEKKLTKYAKNATTGKLDYLDEPVEVLKTSSLPEWKPSDERTAAREERTILAGEKKVRSDMLNRATVLRKEFNAETMYKNSNIIKEGYTKMEKAYQLSTRGDASSRIASDQMIGVIIQKMLDPMSVVRESEYARTPAGASLMNRMEAFLPQLQKGGMAIADEDRRALLEGAKALLDSSNSMLQGHISRYNDLALASDVDPELVVGKELLGSLKAGDTKAGGADINQKIADYGNKLAEQGVPPEQSDIMVANFAKKVRALPIGVNNGTKY